MIHCILWALSWLLINLKQSVLEPIITNQMLKSQTICMLMVDPWIQLLTTQDMLNFFNIPMMETVTIKSSTFIKTGNNSNIIFSNLLETWLSKTLWDSTIRLKNKHIWDKQMQTSDRSQEVSMVLINNC